MCITSKTYYLCHSLLCGAVTTIPYSSQQSAIAVGSHMCHTAKLKWATWQGSKYHGCSCVLSWTSDQHADTHTHTRLYEKTVKYLAQTLHWTICSTAGHCVVCWCVCASACSQGGYSILVDVTGPFNKRQQHTSVRFLVTHRASQPASYPGEDSIKHNSDLWQKKQESGKKTRGRKSHSSQPRGPFVKTLLPAAPCHHNRELSLKHWEVKLDNQIKIINHTPTQSKMQC